MERQRFNEILELDFDNFDSKNVRGHFVNRKDKFIRLYYLYDFKGLISKPISLDLWFQFNDSTQDVEMEIVTQGLKINEVVIFNQLSEKAKELIRADILRDLENYLEYGSCEVNFMTI